MDVVLPVGPGQSASSLQTADADRIVLRFAGGRLSGQIRRADGSAVELAARDLRNLRGQDIRVSVTAGDSVRGAFLISGYQAVAPDTIGPIVMVAGAWCSISPPRRPTARRPPRRR